jgi:hypothetical protein
VVLQKQLNHLLACPRVNLRGIQPVHGRQRVVAESAQRSHGSLGHTGVERADVLHDAANVVAALFAGQALKCGDKLHGARALIKQLAVVREQLLIAQPRGGKLTLQGRRCTESFVFVFREILCAREVSAAGQRDQQCWEEPYR